MTASEPILVTGAAGRFGVGRAVTHQLLQRGLSAHALLRRDHDRAAAPRAARSGVPVLTVRPTIFLESVFALAGPAVRERGRIELPFGTGRTNPVAVADVARVVAAVPTDPTPHLGRVYELTGPLSQDLHGMAGEFSAALGRDITYADIPPEAFAAGLRRAGMAERRPQHVVTMGELHRAWRYDRRADGVGRVTGRPPAGVRAFVEAHADAFCVRRP